MLTLEQRMMPVWDTDRIWEESLTMVKGKDNAAKAPLLFSPQRILSVTNAAGTIRYEEGRDWEWRDGSFCLTPGSRIFAFDSEELYPKEEIPGHSFPASDGYLRFEEGHFFHDRQIAVSYACKRGEWTGVRPTFSGHCLPGATGRLKEGKPLRILLYGDSISVGANASKRTGVPPFQPPYAGLLCQELTRRTGSAVELINPSKGGESSAWGAKNLELLVTCHEFDLLIVAFGMNDGKRTPEEFAQNIRKIIMGVWEKRKEAEILLVATSTPNPLLTNRQALFWGNQYLFGPALKNLASEFGPERGIGVADIAGMQSFLHSRKRFIDTTGNHVNHPNDFFHRCYAQFLTGMLVEQEGVNSY